MFKISLCYQDATINRIQDIAKRAETIAHTLATEETTKNALIMPFIQAFAYDIFNALKVVSQFTTGHGVKKGEKVDYAVKKIMR